MPRALGEPSPCLLALVALAIAGVAVAGAHAESRASGPRGQAATSGAESERLGRALGSGRVIDGATDRRLLHFTFDDGPDPRTTPRLLDALDRAGVRATFFFSTSRFDSHERRNRGTAELAREVARRGHFVGSHSHDHVRMARLHGRALQEQLSKGRAMFERVFASRTWLFRPPYGSKNRELEGYLERERYTTVLWNVGLADWVERPPEALEATFWKVLARNERTDGQRGGIVLLHDTHRWSVEGFERIVRALERRNCELARAGEELYDITDSLAPFLEPPSDAALAERQRALAARLAETCGIATSAAPREPASEARPTAKRRPRPKARRAAEPYSSSSSRARVTRPSP
jgi:peptidoglycan/xylan/chitin deacetylase (PgdA/CDA1 family)